MVCWDSNANANVIFLESHINGAQETRKEANTWEDTLRPPVLDLRSARKPWTVFRNGLPSFARGVRLPAAGGLPSG